MMYWDKDTKYQVYVGTTLICYARNSHLPELPGNTSMILSNNGSLCETVQPSFFVEQHTLVDLKHPNQMFNKFETIADCMHVYFLDRFIRWYIRNKQFTTTEKQTLYKGSILCQCTTAFCTAPNLKGYSTFFWKCYHSPGVKQLSFTVFKCIQTIFW